MSFYQLLEAISIIVVIQVIRRVLPHNFISPLLRIPKAISQKLAPLQGPAGLPIIGCLSPFLVTRRPELVLDKWAEKYGPIYSFWLGNQRFVILSDPNVVKDLLVSQSAIFSSRKDFHIKCHTILAGRGITATPYDAKWRAHRAVAKKWLDKSSVKHRTDQQVLECNKLLKQLSVATEPIRVIDRYVANNILRVTFGADEESLGSAKYNEILEMIWDFVDSTGPMSNAVDFVPFLRYLPSASTTRAQRLHERVVGIIGGILRDMDEQLQAGELLPDCLAKSLLENRGKENHDSLDIVMLCAAFIVPGFASITSVLRALVVTISLHPEAQERAHEELDRIVGRDRPPTVIDEEELPFIRAIIKEVERLHNPLWLGTPHFSTQDFEYRGYLIPKDSVVVINTYTMHHDPQMYPNPHSFMPERYLKDNVPSSESVNAQDPRKRDHWAFGAGRRICPGIHLAEKEIFLAVVHMLWAFHVEAVSQQKNVQEARERTLDHHSIASHEIKMVPRFENLADILDNLISDT